MFKFFMKSPIQRSVEKTNKLQHDIEVLKTQQKVKYENIIADFESRKTQYSNNTDAQIAALKNQIANLEVLKITQIQAYEKEKTVELKKVDNEFDQKILEKTNEVKKLGNLIQKEQRDMEDIVEPTKSNAPKDNRKVLNETYTIGFSSDKIKKTVKKSKAKK